MTSIAQRAELQAKIWKIANDVRGSVDGWDFKQFVLGTLFYRFISENFTNYIQGGDDNVDYANYPDDVITPEIKDDAVTARKKQYEYYREQLLSFEDEEVEWNTLGEVGEFTRGRRFVKTDIISEGKPCIHYGEMYTHYNIWADKSKSFMSAELASKLRAAKKGDVVFVAAGETIEDIGKATAWLGDEDVVIHDACFFYKSSLNPKYVAYYSRTNFFHNQIKKSISSGKISAINAKGFEKVIIPIPSLEEQERIVTILDKFDILTSSISEGLPKEIELRKKQYEYYRDKLLTFPKSESGFSGLKDKQD